MERTAHFSLSTEDSIATSESMNADFSTDVFELQFNETDYTVCVDIPITDDNVTEVLETFTVIISSDDMSVNIGPESSAVVTIVDDDSKHHKDL